MTENGQHLTQSPACHGKESKEQSLSDERLLFDPWDLFAWGFAVLFASILIGWMFGVLMHY